MADPHPVHRWFAMMGNRDVTEEERRVDQEQRSRWRRTIGQLLRWPPTRTQLLWAGGIAALTFLIIVVCGYLFGWKWTGLPKQTLWDWLQLLIIPAVLAGVGLWFNRQQREQELQTANRRAQDEALQAYLDQMSAMLIPDKDKPSLSDEHPPDSLKTVARARTLTVLPRLAGDGKARVLQFLRESYLISCVFRDEQGEVLQEKVVYLSGADLREADLRDSILPEVALDGVNLARASLRLAYLVDADLSGSSLSGADLWEADLEWADLSRADLSGANLRGADLRGANLSGADGWTEGQLRAAKSLEGTTMPDGQILKSKDDPGGPTFEEWLKSRGGGDNATPEQGGPWWGGPYRRPWWRRLFGA